VSRNGKMKAVTLETECNKCVGDLQITRSAPPFHEPWNAEMKRCEMVNLRACVRVCVCC